MTSGKKNLNSKQQSDNIEQFTFNLPPIKGFPELRWAGKRPFRSTHYYPAQLKENHGEPVDGWMNEIYWGDNLQVMSHLLKKYRGKIKLIYIDPPFDSKAEYKRKITLKGKTVTNDQNAFEDKQYTDIWTNDEYLQYMYERLILIKELLSDDGSLYVHCDWRKDGYLRIVLDEIFGPNNIVNEISWCYQDIGGRAVPFFKRKHDTLYLYQKTVNRKFNIQRMKLSQSTIDRYGSYFDENGQITYKWLKDNNPGVFKKLKGHPNDLNEVWLDINRGQPYPDWWTDVSPLKSHFSESLEYPTQKPEALIERIIKASSNPGDIIFDCFMGSGTTQAVALKLGRRFIGADINLGAIQTTTKRLLSISKGLQDKKVNEKEELFVSESSPGYSPIKYYTGFSIYNVNNYDIFRNPVQAKDLLIDALEIQRLPGNLVFDGEKDGRMYKIMPVNRISTRADLNELISNLDYKAFEKRKSENPNKPVEYITIVCMGHDPDLKAELLEQVPYKLDVEIVDILKDRQDIQFRRDSEAEIVIKKGFLQIKSFYPMNLLQKLSQEKENVKDWREMVESIMIDFNYDGSVFEPSEVDIPEKKELVEGKYKIPEDAGNIRVKITDLLSESFEQDVR